MLSLINTFVQQLDHGKCDLTEAISNGKIEQPIKGYFTARGMIEYFQEQEIFISNGEYNSDERVISSAIYGNDNFLQKYEDKKYYSRNVFKFVPVPFENISDINSNFESETNYLNHFSDIYHKFDECLLKMYEFTFGLPENTFSIESETKSIASKYISNFTDMLNSNQGAAKEIKINELLEVLTVVELQDLNDYKPVMEEKLDHDKLEKPSDTIQKRLVLHAISFKRISNYSPVRCMDIGYDGFLGEFNSPFKTCEFIEKLIEQKYSSLSCISDLYKISVEYIANEVCDGNYLLSEYILMCICSRQKINFKADTENVQNCISTPQIVLHISMCKKEFVKRLNSFLLKHLPRLIWINTDISTLNSEHLTPYFDAENDKFVTGILQVPLLRNLIVVDETTLEEGELSEKGLENISNISSLTNFGYVNYGFTAYQVPIKAESNYIVLTSKEKSIFTNNSSISISMDSNNFKTNDCLGLHNKLGTETPNFFKTHFSSVLKIYFSIVGSCIDVLELDEQTQDYIAESFVNIRQIPNIKNLVHASLLHAWIILARTQALMNGEDKLSKQRIEKFLELEFERLEKLSNIGKNTILN